jgi:hypothetical protein
VKGDKLLPLMGSTVKTELMYPVDLWFRASGNPVHVAEPTQRLADRALRDECAGDD